MGCNRDPSGIFTSIKSWKPSFATTLGSLQGYLLGKNEAGSATVPCLLHNKKVNADEHLKPRIEALGSVSMDEKKRILTYMAILR